ncbi:MAG: thiamine biosynthesis protein ThiS [Planctomycetes bacterium GWF2_42_9]|nr:MAG: thiamine biosynthesis protein ThiS [Planctomycetes bacterium GWF2_42_9]HAL44896.1 thiamine biosynthesis protein ThiS [Phycisphaerales bacterium]
MAKLIINGENKDFENTVPATLTALLDALKVDEATVVAEVNGEIIPRSSFQNTILDDGHKIELVRFVGGG